MRGTQRVLFGAFSAALVAAVFYGFVFPTSSSAAINQQISFQGKLVNPADGTNIANGSYSIRFRIYTSTAPTDAAVACLPGSNTCQWEDTQSITVTDGTFYYALGSNNALPGSVDFNGSALYLGIKVGADAEMTPRVQFTAAPYAFNSNMLGGITAAGFLQLAPSAAQADSSANASIFVNDTGGGNLLQLQTGGGTPVDKFVVSSAGALTAASTLQGTVVNGTTGINTGAAGGTQRIDASGNLVNVGNITGTAVITLQSGGTGALNLATNAQTLGTTNSANITLTTGNASGATSTAGNITLDVGTSNNGSTVGAIQIGTAARQQTITVGNNTAGTTVGFTAAAGISLNSNTTVAGTSTLTVSGGATSLTGPSAGSLTALTVTSGAATNKGIRVTMTGASATAFEVFSGVTSSVVATIDNAGDLFLGNTGVTGNVSSPDVTTAATNSVAFNVGSGRSTVSGNTGVVTLQSGNATSGTSGNVGIDNGSSTSGTPAITLGNTNSRSISLGNNTAATVVAVLVGNTTSAFTVQATGANNMFSVDASANDVVNVGTSSNGASFKNYLSAGNQATFVANAAPTADMVTIANTGQANTTAGVSGLQINYVGGNAAIEASAARVDLTPGGTSGGTWNGYRVVANPTGAVSGVSVYGVNLDGPTSPGAGAEVGIAIDANWDAGLQLGAKTSEPGTVPTDNIYVYARKIAGRSMLRQKGPSGVSFAYQPALFEQAITYQGPNTTTTVTSFGTSWTVDTTASHPASSEIFGYSTNFATAATTNDTAGVAEAVTQHYRGSVANGSNGFFYVARLGLPDANYGAGATGARIWTGLTSGTAASMTAGDNPAGSYAGFQYSTNRGDTAWQFITKDGTTQSTPTATLAIAQNKVYDFYVYTPSQGTTIYWRIDNLTDGTTQEGSTTTNLPVAATALRAGTSLQTLTTTARNIRVLKHYVESDR